MPGRVCCCQPGSLLPRGALGFGPPAGVGPPALGPSIAGRGVEDGSTLVLETLIGPEAGPVDVLVDDAGVGPDFGALLGSHVAFALSKSTLTP